MTSRIDLRRFSSFQTDGPRAASEASAPSAATEEVRRDVVRPAVTRPVIDEAVDNVLRKLDYSETEKRHLRTLLSSDFDSGFASSFHTDRAALADSAPFRRKGQRDFTVSHVLPQDKVAQVTQYAPEFRLRFTDRESHDHPVAAACRQIDKQILYDRLPKGVPFKDVGGDPLWYIERGITRVHLCNPAADRKDSARATLRRMRARVIASDPDRSAEVRELARRFLDRDESFVCSKKAQDCTYKVPFVIAPHVYELPLQDWPRVMRSAGAILHMGCVNFPTAAFQQDSGVMDMVGATYEVDAKKNRIKMGFVGSAAWWYDHSWVDFMRYGVDQLVSCGDTMYSYKVAERRYDTFFYDVLPVSSGVTMVKQVYALPNVEMVHVNGYELYGRATWRIDTAGRSNLHRKQYRFPARLWRDMLVQAEADFERGVFQFDKLYNYYRTTAPRNTINGLLMTGGTRVELDHLVPLVVHVGIVAASRVMLGQRQSRAHTTDAMRMRNNDGLIKNFLGAAYGLVKSLLKLTVILPYWFVQWYTGLLDGSLARALVDAHEEPAYYEVPFSSLIHGTDLARGSEYTAADAFRTIAKRAAPTDHSRAAGSSPGFMALMDVLYAGDKRLSAKLQENAEPESTFGGTTAVTGTESGEAVVPEPAASDGPVVSAELAESRAMAIQEAIDESDLEERKLRELAASVYSKAVSGSGTPRLDVLRNRAEEWDGADLWFATGGRLTTSVLGKTVAACRASAAYLPAATPPRFASLARQTDRDEGTGIVLVGEDYTGYVVITDRMNIFTGPFVRQALVEALTRPLDLFRVKVNEGPPGCGKTYSMMQSMREGDVVMCPVREAAEATRESVERDKPWFPNPKHGVGTLDSYLVNFDTPAKRRLSAKRLLADEGYMTHAGRWYAAAALLGCREFVAYGDVMQIPHVPRVQAPSQFLRLRADEKGMVWVSLRNPHDAVAAYAHQYDQRVRSGSSIRRSLKAVTDWRSLEKPKSLTILVMYQEGKKTVAELLGSVLRQSGVKLMTVHESEGKTFDNVWLFRFDTRARSDGMSLYDKDPYVLVAMSRHRVSFTYIRPRNLSDKVDQWIDIAKNEKLVTAVADVSTAGERVSI